MDWLTGVQQALTTFITEYGLLAVFFFLLLEEAGVPFPIPGDVMMLVLGIQARQGRFPVWQPILAMQVATMIGATILYVVSGWAGRGLVYRYGRYIGLTPARLDRAEHWLAERGARAVLLGRVLPGCRVLTAVGCGIFSVRPWVFLPAVSLGALVYLMVYTLLGYYVGTPVLDLLGRLHLPLGTAGSLLLLLGGLAWLLRARRALHLWGRTHLTVPRTRDRIQAGALAGLLATLASALLVSILVNVVGGLIANVPQGLAEQIVARLARPLESEVRPVLLFVIAPMFIVVGVVWGAVYGCWVETRLPWADWVRGPVFSVGPLVTLVLLVMPLVGVGAQGVGVSRPLAVTEEFVRHLLYGAVLGLLYPVLLTWSSPSSDG